MKEDKEKKIEETGVTNPQETVQNEQSHDNPTIDNADKKKEKGEWWRLAKVFLISLVLSGIILIVFNIINEITDCFRVSWSRPLTTTTELVRYKNDSYQLRSSFDHKRQSKRYKAVNASHIDQDSIIILKTKSGDLEIFSLECGIITGKGDWGNSHWEKVFRPDQRGVSAVLDNKNMLHFVSVHLQPHLLPKEIPVSPVLNGMSEIRFEGDYCIIPHLERGLCLIDTVGNILIEGCWYINLIGDDYILTGDINAIETLYDAHDLRPIVSNKEDIFVTPVGIRYFDGDIYYLLDSTGTRILTDFIIDKYSLDDLYEPYEDEKLSPYKVFDVNGSMGVMDQDYRVIIDPVWDHIDYLGNDYFSCELDMQIVILDKTGRMVNKNINN